MANTTARTRKAAAATKTATANITAARKVLREATKKPAAKKVAAKKTAAAPATDKPKKEQTFEERDWTYLDDKPPSEQHEILAKEINRRTNLMDDDGEDMPISPKQVQAVLAMFPHFQRSATNKARSGYHALAPEIVEKRSEHMTLAHQEAREILDGLQLEAAAKLTKKAPAKAPAKKAAAKAVAPKPASPITAETVIAGAQAAAKKAAPVRKARVTKKAVATPAPAADEAF